MLLDLLLKRLFAKRAQGKTTVKTQPLSPNTVIVGQSRMVSVLKALSWRTIGTIDTILITYFLSGQWEVAIGVGSLELLTKTVLFFFHERIWNAITLRWYLRPSKVRGNIQ